MTFINTHSSLGPVVPCNLQLNPNRDQCCCLACFPINHIHTAREHQTAVWTGANVNLWSSFLRVNCLSFCLSLVTSPQIPYLVMLLTTKLPSSSLGKLEGIRIDHLESLFSTDILSSIFSSITPVSEYNVPSMDSCHDSALGPWYFIFP